MKITWIPLYVATTTSFIVTLLASQIYNKIWPSPITLSIYYHLNTTFLNDLFHISEFIKTPNDNVVSHISKPAKSVREKIVNTSLFTTLTCLDTDYQMSCSVVLAVEWVWESCQREKSELIAHVLCYPSTCQKKIILRVFIR
jgi:hypothetical protein